MNAAWALGGAGAAIAGCWSAGVVLCRCLRMPLPANPVVFGAGAAVLSTLLFAICAGRLLSLSVMLVLLGALLGFAFTQLRTLRPHFSPWLLALAPFAVWYFVYALAPEVSADGAYYHLTYPRQYLEHGGFFPIVYNMYASLPQGLEMLFLPAIAIGGFSAAALVHLAFLVALSGAIVSYGKGSTAAWLAATLVFASPVIGFDASIAYNDVALACCTFLAFMVAQSIDRESPRAAILAGILGGFCFAIKYTGALAIPFVVAMAALRTRSLKWTLLTAAAACAVAAPWLVKNWIWLDNPVSPFFNRVFANPHVRVDLEDQYRANMRHFGGHTPSALQTPLELTVRGGQLQGVLGPVFLLAPLALLGSWRITLVGLFFALPWTQNLGTRFLIPSLPFFAYALSLFLARLPWAAYGAAALHLLSAWPPILALYCTPWCWRLEEFPWRAALRIEPEQAFLARRIPETYPIVELINAKTEQGSRVYTALPLPDAYCNRTVLLDYASALSNAIRDGFKTGPAQTRAALAKADVRYLVIHRDEPHAKALEAAPNAWGVEKIGESGPGRLYKVI